MKERSCDGISHLSSVVLFDVSSNHLNLTRQRFRFYSNNIIIPGLLAQ